jgi:hypothetical protein
VLFIPREVEIEIRALPGTAAKAPLIEYIRRSTESCAIRTTSIAGFYVAGAGPQRYGGPGQGTFQSPTERQFYSLIRERFLLGKGERKSGLSANEGDAAVAANSFFAVVLTNERPSKPGPLRFAAERGGKVLYLAEFAASGRSLRDYVVAFEKAP